MLIQNGIGIKEEVKDILPNEIIRAVTGIGAEIIRPGEVRTSWGKVVLENTKSVEKYWRYSPGAHSRRVFRTISNRKNGLNFRSMLL